MHERALILMPKPSQDVPDDYIEYKCQLAKKIGKRIKDRRVKLSFSQREVREKMQLESVFITRSQYSRLENGEKLPLASEIIALCSVLKVTSNWLLDINEPKK